MTKTRFYFSLLLVFISLFCLFEFQIQEERPIWTDWRVFAVDSILSEQRVLSELHNAGVTQVISYSTTKDATYANNTVESVYNTQFSPLLPNAQLSYAEKISVYFFDKNKNYRLYYIPNNAQQLQLVEQVAERLAVDWGIDEHNSTPLMPALVVCLFFILLCYFSRNKIIFSFLSLPFILLVFLAPTAFICISSAFIFFILFIIQRQWYNTDSWQYFKKNLYFLLLCVSSFLVTFLGGFVSFFLSLCACVCSASILYAYVFMQKLLEKRRSFIPLSMRPVRKKDFVGKKQLYFCILLIAVIVSIQLFFTFFKQFSPSSGIEGLSIPAPMTDTITSSFDMRDYKTIQNAQGSSIPNLTDFVQFAWNSAAFPYTKLYDEQVLPEPGTKIIFPRYVYSKEGKISVEPQTILTFDTRFLETLFSNLRKMHPVIETVFYSQGGFFIANYTDELKSTVATNSSLLFFVIVILSGLLLFLFKANKWLK